MPNVAMPNGDVVTFPDDMQPEQIKGMIATKFPDASKETFLSRVGTDLGNRWKQGQQDVNKYPEMAPVVGLGVAAGSANDVIGQGINAVTPDFIKQGLATGANATADALNKTNAGQGLGDTLLATKDKFNNFMQSNPRTAIALRAAGNAASLLPFAKGAEPIVQEASAVAQNASNGLKGLSDLYTAKYPEIGTAPLDPLKMKVATPISGDMVRMAGNNAYKAVKDSGTVFSPGITDKAVDLIDAAKQKPLFGGKVLTSEQADINSALDDYSAARGQPMTMDDLQGLDSTLGDKAAQAYVSGNYNKGRVVSDVQDKIRQMITKTPESDVVSGSSEGADILMNHAVPLWSTQAKMGDLERIVENANNSPNPSTAIQTGFKTLMRNRNKFNQYPAEVQKIIAKTAKSGIADDLLGVIGSRLNQIAGGALGGPQGYAASTAMAMTGRGIRSALKNNQASAALDAMVEQVRPSIEKFADYKPSVQAAPEIPVQPTLREIMSMPPAQAKAALAKIKAKP